MLLFSFNQVPIVRQSDFINSFVEGAKMEESFNIKKPITLSEFMGHEPILPIVISRDFMIERLIETCKQWDSWEDVKLEANDKLIISFELKND